LSPFYELRICEGTKQWWTYIALALWNQLRSLSKHTEAANIAQGKGIVIPGLYYVLTMPWRRMREWRCSFGIFYLCTRWTLMVSFTALPLYPRKKSAQYWLDRRLGGPESRSGRSGEEKNFLPLSVNQSSISLSSSLLPSHYTR
jgi:hypothetical protein